MCNVIPNSRLAFAFLLSVLVAGCGIKWATNKVLSNPEAIAKVGAVYDNLNPRDTTEKLFFIAGDSIIIENNDTAYITHPIYRGEDVIMDESLAYTPKRDTIRINTIRTIRRTDTIKITLPPDNRAMARLLDSLGKYTNELNQAKGSIKEKDKGLKTANNRLLWMAAIILLLGVVIGLLIKFKVKL
jgi:hypothetical protein